MKSTEYYLGFCVGILVVVIFIFVVCKVLKKNKTAAKYDERQLLARGKAFQAGFFGTLIADAAAIVICGAFEISWLPPAVLFAIAALIGIGIFCISAIVNDAYFGFNQDTKTSGRFIVVIGGLNLIIGIISVVRGGFIQDGTLNGSVLNLLLGILFVITYSVILVHNRQTETEGEE